MDSPTEPREELVAVSPFETATFVAILIDFVNRQFML